MQRFMKLLVDQLFELIYQNILSAKIGLKDLSDKYKNKL